MAMHTRRQKGSIVKWQKFAPLAVGGLFLCLISFYSMPAWHHYNGIDHVSPPTIAPEVSQGQQAALSSRKDLANSIPLITTATPTTAPTSGTTCSAEDRAYQDGIVKDTSIWRNKTLSYHYRGYGGPWIEDQFFTFWHNNSDGCPINGRFYLPIYHTLAYKTLSKEETPLIGDYLGTLDTSKKYFTILLTSKGMHILSYEPPADLDLMIFAAGGITTAAKTTNVPVPLLIKEQHMTNPRLPKTVTASFAGSLDTHPIRKQLVELYEDEFYLVNKEKDWQELMEQSLFCIAPRG
jgi:hypothetical protein